MPETEISTSLLVWLTLVLIVSGVSYVGARNWLQPRAEPPAMEIRTLDYLIFIWCLFMVFFVLQSLYSIGASPAPAETASEPVEPTIRAWPLVLGALSLQIPLLAVTLVAHSSARLPFAHPELSAPGSTFTQEALYGIRSFFMALPIIWLATFIWRGILHGLSTIIEGIPISNQTIVDTVATDIDLLPVLILTFIGVAIAPIAEELFFRGSIYRFVKSKLNIAMAGWISALLFALMHANLGAFVPLLLVGWFLSRVYELRGSIIAPIAFHAAFNAQSFVIIFLMRNTA